MNDQALIDRAKLNLAYCRITSPISGRVSSRLLNPGDIVHIFDTQGLMAITELQPIAVIFSMPACDLERAMKATGGGGSQMPVAAYDCVFNNQLATEPWYL